MANVIPIKSYSNRTEADLAKSFLESRGIKSIVSADDAGGMNPWLLKATGGARLLVKEEDGKTALDLLENKTGSNGVP